MSAILKVTRNIDNDIWKITFSIDPLKLSEADKQLMAKFGEPEINVGGTIDGPTIQGEETEYTLPAKYIKIRSGLPYTREFDSKTTPFNTHTQEKAEAYQAAFVSRYTQALVELRANEDTFSGEFLVNI
jgi:hypothetical protein